MRFYELLYIARSDLTTSQLYDLNSTITSIIQDNTQKETNNCNYSGGSVYSTDSWGIKSLAYKSKKLKRNKGYFCLINFSLTNYNILKELNNRLKINESILRFVVKHIDKPSTKSFPKQTSDVVNSN